MKEEIRLEEQIEKYSQQKLFENQKAIIIDDQLIHLITNKTLLLKIGFEKNNIHLINASEENFYNQLINQLEDKKYEQNPPFLLIDYEMPHMKGDELVENILEFNQYNNLNIIGVSSENKFKDFLESKNIPFIKKPVAIDTLETTIKKYLTKQ